MSFVCIEDISSRYMPSVRQTADNEFLLHCRLPLHLNHGVFWLLVSCSPVYKLLVFMPVLPGFRSECTDPCQWDQANSSLHSHQIQGIRSYIAVFHAFEVEFCGGWEMRVPFHSSEWRSYWTCPVPFVFPSVCRFCFFVKNKVTIRVLVCIWVLNSIPFTNVTFFLFQDHLFLLLYLCIVIEVLLKMSQVCGCIFFRAQDWDIFISSSLYIVYFLTMKLKITPEELVWNFSMKFRDL